MLTARITTLETQLQIESARAQTAEQETSTLIQTFVTTRQERGGGMADTKGIGQPFMWKGSADQDFGEWSHEVRTFMLARFGDDILSALNVGSTTAKDRCQDLRSFAEEPHDILEHCLRRTSRTRRD